MATRRKAAPPRASTWSLVILYGTAAAAIFGAAAGLSSLFSGSADEAHTPPSVLRDRSGAEAPAQAGGATGPGVSGNGTSSAFLYVPGAKLMSDSERDRTANKQVVAAAVAQVQVDSVACRNIARNSALYCKHVGEKKGPESASRCEDWMEGRIRACNAGDTDPGIRTDF